MKIFQEDTKSADIKVINSDNAVLSFGIGSKPVWLMFSVNNTTKQSIVKYLQIQASWLDNISIFYFKNNQLIHNEQLGDNLKFNNRPIDARFFTSAYQYPLVTTDVLIYVDSVDPMLLPIFLLDDNQLHHNNYVSAYSYGLLYGAVISLLIYNFILFFALKKDSYLYYSIYLFAFLCGNFSYTGHAYQWLWPEAIVWQKWANPVFMMFFNISGIIFAKRFLDLKRNLKQTNQNINYYCYAFISFLCIAIMINNHFLTMIIAFSFMLLFPLVMVYLGVISLRHSIIAARYFLIASIFAVLGSGITALAVWGFIPYNNFTYRAVELGIVIDVILLALALGELYRTNEKKKIIAERLARIDPLTNLGNRRDFYEHVEKIWPRLISQNKTVSVIIADIDHFKLINDEFGHSFGDNVLFHIAESIRDNARSRDVAVRWGGEEFVLLLPDTTQEKAIQIADRIRKTIESLEFNIKGKEITITSSFGVAELHHHSSIDELINAADFQLYRAKSLGRNCVTFDEEAHSMLD